ncbi:MAG: IclR family transcriptional regulator [Pseudolysinimonas sp.]
MARTNEPGRSVTDRVLSILAVFEGSLTPKSLSDIAESAGLAISTTHRLLAELERWGAVQRDPHGRYQIGIRLWELGQNAGRQLREVARPLLQDLYSLTQETSHIAIRDRAEVLYLDRVYGTKRVPQAGRVGGRLPLHATAVGKAILAYETEWVREAILHHRLEGRTAFTHVDPDQLRVELAQIRDLGFATTREEVRLGSCSIAVPVFHRDGTIGGALGIVMSPTPRREMERHLPVLRGIAHQIEARTGGLPLSSMRPATSRPVSR